MNQTQAEDVMLYALHRVGAIEGTDDLMEAIATGEQHRSPLDEIERSEFDHMFNHLVDLGFITQDPLGERTRYYRISKSAYERLCLPGSDAAIRRNDEMRALTRTKLGVKHISRNQVLEQIAFALDSMARGIHKLAVACEGRNETIRENTRAIDRTAKEARENTRDIVAAIFAGREGSGQPPAPSSESGIEIGEPVEVEDAYSKMAKGE